MLGSGSCEWQKLLDYVRAGDSTEATYVDSISANMNNGLHAKLQRVENMNMIMNSSITIWKTFVRVIAWSGVLDKTSTQNNLCDEVSGFQNKTTFCRPCFQLLFVD